MFKKEFWRKAAEKNLTINKNIKKLQTTNY